MCACVCVVVTADEVAADAVLAAAVVLCFSMITMICCRAVVAAALDVVLSRIIPWGVKCVGEKVNNVSADQRPTDRLAQADGPRPCPCP